MEPIRSAEILAVGSELLTPFRTDTNSLHLTAELNALGIEVRAKGIVGDDRRELASWIAAALARADVVITTGGLGPTDDDLTREAVADALGLALQEDPDLLRGIEARFAKRRLAMPEINRRQAQVPLGAEPLANPNGTAPGLWIEHRGRVLVLLPGPPREMQAMFDASVKPRLASLSGGHPLRRRVIKTTGWTESQVDAVAAPVYRTFRGTVVPIQTTILATPGQIELHLAAGGVETSEVDRALDDAVGQLAAALGSIAFSVDGRTLEEVVGDRLRTRSLRIAAAESCTGGLLLGRLTNVPGSSHWVVGGIVAYDNGVKIAQLGVPADLLAAHGAVSEPVAVAMAEGVRAALGSEVGVAITGIAGPGGGTPDKPVGTVVLAVAIAGAAPSAITRLFAGSRQMVRIHAVAAALDLVRRAVD